MGSLMGNIKDSLKKEKKHTLTDGEFNFLERLILLRNQSNTAYNQLASAFLSFVAGNRLGYKEGSELQFEVDFDKGTKVVKVREM